LVEFPLLSKYRISHPEYALARAPSEVLAAARKLGFPIAMKVISPDVQHKSDRGGVILNIQDMVEVEKAGILLIERYKGAKMQNILLQRMVDSKDSVELIIGGKRDAQFGQLIMLGMGGIFVEVFKDVSFRICPLSKQDAQEMVHELKSYPILAGARGRKPIDKRALVSTLLKVSQLLVDENPAEFDINPLIAGPEGCTAVDVRVIR
jgi:acyl-CoA synthetase (NDP forming)